jgi:hypothetical protein
MTHDQGGKTPKKDDYRMIGIRGVVHAMGSSVTGEINLFSSLYTSLDDVGTCSSTGNVIYVSPCLRSAHPYPLDEEDRQFRFLVYFVICDDPLQREDTVNSPHQWEENGR